MFINLYKRSITLSVRELAEFQGGPVTGSMRRSLKRAQLGQKWHQEARRLAENEYPEARFEVPLKATFMHREWAIELEGRVDQWIEMNGHLRLIEVKTVGFNLPLAPQFLLQRFPEYVCQAVAYGFLVRKTMELDFQSINCELLWIDHQTGNTQAIPLSLGDEGLFHSQLEAISQFADAQYRQYMRFKAIEFSAPYPWRIEQKKLLDEIHEWDKTEKSIATCEAPTGFGKTGVWLYWALKALQSEKYERLIFVTHKITGAQTALRELERIGQAQGALRIHPFRSKEAHRITSPLHTCDPFGLDCQNGLQERWKNAQLNLDELFDGEVFSLKKAKELGARYGLCPYILSRSALKLANIWICDSNYIFSKSHEGIFNQQPGYDPKKTLLLIDEAHHLPTRVAHAFSQFHSFEKAHQLQQELTLGDVPTPLLALWSQWVDFLSKLEVSNNLDESILEALFPIAQNLSDALQQFLMIGQDLPAEIRMHLWEAVDLYDFLIDERLEKFYYVPAPGTLAMICLDAKRVIRKKIEGFGRTVLLSATLAPVENFIQTCGLKAQQAQFLEAESPWRKEAYDIVIDKRIDTRYRLRPQSYKLTTETLVSLMKASQSPVVAFFPSFAYAQEIAKMLSQIDPSIPFFLQSSSGNPSSEILEQSFENCKILLLILGSAFAESVDILGGRVQYALIAGLGLPAQTPIEEAQKNLHLIHGETQAFRQVYQIPAMRKINQALGRFVRQPGQSVRVILHCQRFEQETYQNLLHADYRTDQTLENDQALGNWI